MPSRRRSSSLLRPSLRRAVALAAAFAAAAAPAAGQGLSAPKLLAGDAAPAPPDGSQHGPRMARGAGVHLVVWADARNTLDEEFFAPPSLYDEDDQDVFARRLDANGAPLDAGPLPIAVEAGAQTVPRVAWNGETFLVAWMSQVSTEFFYTAELHAVRVTEAGEILDADPIVVQQFSALGAGQFALASDGNDWLIVTQGSDVRSFRIDASGTLLDPGGKLLASPLSFYGSLELGFEGGEYLLAYSESNAIRGRRLAVDGSGIGGAFTIANSSDDELNPALASNGTGFFVAWEVNGAGALITGYVRGARVMPGGVVLDPAGIELTGDVLGFHPRHPGVAWDGAQWVVVFDRFPATTQELRAVRVSATGAVLDFGGVPIGAVGDELHLVTAFGSGVELAWADKAFSVACDVSALHLGGDLAAGPHHGLSDGAPRQSGPDLAPAPYGFLAAFMSEVSGEDRVLVERLDPFGNPLDGEPALVAAGADLGVPKVAWNGVEHLVVWEDFPDEVLARRVAADGTPAGPVFAVMGGDEPDVAASGATFLVVATDTPVNPEIKHPFARTVATGGELGPGPVQLGASFSRNVAVSGMDGRFLAVWQRHPTHDNPSSSVRGAFVELDGTSPGEFLLASSDEEPDVASSGAEALIVWQAGFTDRRLEAQRIAVTGALLGGELLVSDGPSHQTHPAVAWDGAQYVVAWQDLRDQTAFWDERPDVFAARVSAGGAVLDPAGFAVFAAGEEDVDPAVGGGAAGALHAAATLMPELPLVNLRVRVRLQGGWESVGPGLAGAAGVPVLEAAGALAPGVTVSVAVAGGAPGAPGGLVIGFSEVALPLFGGVLVPSPDVVVPLALSGTGAASLALPVAPAGLPPGTSVFLQAGFVDAGAVQGFAFTQALAAQAP